MKCKRQGCEREVGRDLESSGMVYCSRDCSPYGRYGQEEEHPRAPRAQRPARETQPKPRVPRKSVDKFEARLRQFAADGFTALEVAEWLGMGVGTIRLYAQKSRIPLR